MSHRRRVLTDHVRCVVSHADNGLTAAAWSLFCFGLSQDHISGDSGDGSDDGSSMHDGESSLYQSDGDSDSDGGSDYEEPSSRLASTVVAGKKGVKQAKPPNKNLISPLPLLDASELKEKEKLPKNGTSLNLNAPYAESRGWGVKEVRLAVSSEPGDGAPVQ